MGKMWRYVSKTHPLEITVGHSLVVYIDQPPRDVAQLPYHIVVNDGRGLLDLKQKTYEFEPIRIWMCLHKLVDVPVCHPL